MRRSQLYVPANNERMIRKAALELSPDTVILDLEDSVPPEEKEKARELLLRLVPELDWSGKELCVRVNPLDTPFFYADMNLVLRLDKAECVVVPKAEAPLSFIHKGTGRRIEPLIETAGGLLRIEDVSGAREYRRYPTALPTSRCLWEAITERIPTTGSSRRS